MQDNKFNMHEIQSESELCGAIYMTVKDITVKP